MIYIASNTPITSKNTFGWTLAEIMKANRHTSISTTEIYLKKLGQFVDIKAKVIPVI